MNIKSKITFFKILMFVSAFLFGLTLINFRIEITKIAISSTFILVSIGSYYEWYVLSKKENL